MKFLLGALSLWKPPSGLRNHMELLAGLLSISAFGAREAFLIFDNAVPVEAKSLASSTNTAKVFCSGSIIRPIQVPRVSTAVPGRYRESARRPETLNFDMLPEKQVSLREEYALILRVEFFNSFYRPQLSGLNAHATLRRIFRLYLAQPTQQLANH
jgi:hypothetical protein